MATTTSSIEPKLQIQIDRARLEATRLRELLASERAAIRALKAAHAADLRKTHTTSRMRELELRKQLSQAQRANFESQSNSECEECNKIRNECEAELRKDKNEWKKKETCLISQINELKSIKNDEKRHKTDCEECTKVKNTFEADARKERGEFKKREADLMTQIKELKALTSTNAKICKEGDEHTKLRTNEVELKRERSDCKKSDECSKLRLSYENELKKQKIDFKQKESSFICQISELSKELSNLKSKINDDAIKLRKNYEDETKKMKQEFRRKESCLVWQINELKSKINSVCDKKTDCDQCSRYKAILEAELKKERCEFKKKEALLQIQLSNAQRVKNDGKRDLNVKSECSECMKVNKEIAKQKDLVRQLEEKIEVSFMIYLITRLIYDLL